ncbi:hypothetical protein [Rhodanobacter sp. DHB23]|uniref:hypothetical protein n=1 Tax=Rhodanobacter sp. DHB23 TaxID=2775923 RepID=UPI001785A1F7|nr:hypothetical protein [Rhodanobacter sp. DHB23]MBD8872328.1 hypothetical protein [Rhodanobacter sp. DHB23]
MICTVSRLQREFGLPYHVAEGILREQMALAQRSYRLWYIPVWVGIAAVLACNFAPNHSVFFRAGHFIPPISIAYLCVTQFLTYRHAQAPILAAARAAMPDAPA